MIPIPKPKCKRNPTPPSHPVPYHAMQRSISLPKTNSQVETKDNHDQKRRSNLPSLLLPRNRHPLSKDNPPPLPPPPPQKEIRLILPTRPSTPRRPRPRPRRRRRRQPGTLVQRPRLVRVVREAEAAHAAGLAGRQRGGAAAPRRPRRGLLVVAVAVVAVVVRAAEVVVQSACGEACGGRGRGVGAGGVGGEAEVEAFVDYCAGGADGAGGWLLLLLWLGGLVGAAEAVARAGVPQLVGLAWHALLDELLEEW